MNQEGEEGAGRDDELVARAKDGDSRAFEELFTRHHRRIYALAYRMTGNASDAEDLCQEAFLAAFRKLGSFQGRSSFSTWLYRVAINRSRDYLRGKSRASGLVAEELTARAADDRRVHEGEPEPGAIASEARDLVHKAVSTLPGSLRLPLVLHELEGLKYEEVARLLRLPVGTVKSRIFRARVRLAELLEPHREQWMG